MPALMRVPLHPVGVMHCISYWKLRWDKSQKRQLWGHRCGAVDGCFEVLRDLVVDHGSLYAVRMQYYSRTLGICVA